MSAVGLLAAGIAAAAAIVLPPGRHRAIAMLLALALFPLLILADQWQTAQIADLRDEPAILIALALLAVAAAVVALATCFRRIPFLLPLAVVFALPFRVPLEAGGDTANLLVPLYLVIAAGVLSAALREWGGPASPRRFRGDALSWALAAVVALYAAQALYSPDFSKSLQNFCFFFVPFSLVYALFREVEWTPRLLLGVFVVLAAEALAFVLVGSVEYATRSLFWNDQVIRSNEFHTYFRVNSIFWDPNIYGRFLAIVLVLATTAMLWARERRRFVLLTALIAILWLGLVPTFSQSSFAALLAGLAVLAAIRWSLRWTLAATAAAAIFAVVVIIFAGGNASLTFPRLNVDTGGRANLVSGGAELFSKRPVWGYGAGSFPRAYREHVATKKMPVSVSHTEPVTVAAEQGLVGLVSYTALLLAALFTMGSGLRAGGAPRPEPAHTTARIAVLAAFVALLVHTLAYAGFYEDPIAWVLMALGGALAAGPVRDGT